METRILSPRAELLTDPRPAMEKGALVLASRNVFPVVASRKARKDGLGLAAGAVGALILGSVTFLSMSGGRNQPVQRTLPPPVTRSEPPKKQLPAVIPPPQAIATAPAVLPVTTLNPAVDRLHSPVMVLDTSSPTAIQPHTASGAHVATQPGAAGSQQALSENEAFGARVGGSGVDVASASRMADPANTVTQGTLIPAILETAIDSDLPGYVRAVVSQDVRSFDGSRVLIPRSTRLIGQYKSGLSAGQTRAYVMWTRLIRPDGASVALASPAIDFAGRTGLTGQVNSHFMKRFGSAMLMSVVGGLGTLAGGTSVTLSSGQSAASVAAQRDSTIPPTIRIPQGQPIRVFTARDLDFSTVAQAQEPAR
jgi:type IV secretion system protein VirB10